MNALFIMTCLAAVVWLDQSSSEGLDLFYLLTIVLPFFVTRLKHTRLIGVTFLLAFLVSLFYFRDGLPQMPTLLSVVCWLAVRRALPRKKGARMAQKSAHGS